MAQATPQKPKDPGPQRGRETVERKKMTGAEQHRHGTTLPGREDDTAKEVTPPIDLDRVIWDPEYRMAVRHLFKPGG